METVIPWATVDPTIRSEEPFVGVVIIDPSRRLCISDLVSLEDDQLANPLAASGEIMAAAQQAATRLAAAYRRQRAGGQSTASAPAAQCRPALRVLQGAFDPASPVRRRAGARVRPSRPAILDR